MRRLYMFGGSVLVASGAFFIFMIYGFASMIDPTTEGVATEAEIWRSVIHEPSFSIWVMMILSGVWLMFQKPNR